jgi:hypothetical protein
VSLSDVAASIPADRLPSVIDGWLWEFHDPANWPDAPAVRELIDALQQRPDAAGEAVQAAIRKCRAYLRAA